MSQQHSIPVTLVAGFLGAGKTTLLNHLLNSDHGRRMAVMVNDFGAINIDSQLIVSQTQTTVSLANGCICCTVEGDLIAQLSTLLADPQTRPEHLVIEASGVSNPVKIANTLRYPQFRQSLHIDGILTVVDAAQFDDLDSDMTRLATEQLDAADIIILNKTDLLTPDQRTALKSRWLYPNARVIESEHGVVPLALLLGVERKTTAEPVSPDGRHAPASTPSTTTFETFKTVPHQHDSLFDTWSWQSDIPLNLKALRNVMASLPAAIYRAKGICHVAEARDQRCILHLVGTRCEITPAGPWKGATPSTQLIMIGKRGAIDANTLRTLLEACHDEVEPTAVIN
ncbi:GTP-binding protein [Cobetia sp. QF-1]|uniref:CobW family GTP-binding protein n=1 Tax=Cobetia sp. QF-1 TaxID=1969833 RepID=UPI000B5463C1|nr:GTP-binding protein [Cobetia sp. QF-1]